MSDEEATVPAAAKHKQFLVTYLVYRVLMSAVLLGAFFAEIDVAFLGRTDSALYLITAIVFFALAVLSLFACHKLHYIPQKALLFFILLTDIVCYSLMMFASGGLASGLGYLTLVTVAAGAFLFSGQLGVLTAAVASICIIMESAISTAFDLHTVNNIFASGILGILLFITALLIQGLNRSLAMAEARAKSESLQSAQLQQLNEVIVNRMLTGIIVVNKSGHIELINQAARQLLNSERNSNLMPGGNLHGEPELQRRLDDWKKRHTIRANPFSPRYSNSEITATFKSADLHQQEKTIIFLEDFRSATQQAQQLKLASLGRLTGSIAHEIRNPLGAISHAAQLLEEQYEADAQAQRLTNIIGKQVSRVNQIVENVLQLSRKRSHNFKRLQLQNWLEIFVTDYVTGSNLEPKINIEDDDREIFVSFDPSHLGQILTNLLDNALRYSHQTTGNYWAGIRLGMGSVDKIPYMDIVDKGPGVPHDQQGKLFEPFFTTSNEGSGLGLYIARELCQINFATLNYYPSHNYKPGYFRIGFAHPGKIFASDSNDQP